MMYGIQSSDLGEREAMAMPFILPIYLSMCLCVCCIVLYCLIYILPATEQTTNCARALQAWMCDILKEKCVLKYPSLPHW